MTILVTGGAGYIGSHMVVKLANRGYDVVIVDDFSNSQEQIIERINRLCNQQIKLYRLNLCSLAECNRMFSENDFDAVIHFAGSKSPTESVRNPLKYYHNNIFSTLNVLTAMKEYSVKKFIFSSSATVYGEPEQIPITEQMPLKAVNPYGRTKIMIEEILRDMYSASPDTAIAILRYFNPVGAHSSGEIGELPTGIPNNIMPYLSQVTAGILAEFPITGTDYDTRDGTGVRDYIHVDDLVEGHLAALHRMDRVTDLFTVNLGTGQGYTVREIISAYEKASGIPIATRTVDRRPGDIAQCYADVTLAKTELGFTAKLTLEDMCSSSWNWQSKNPNGYE
ncbi:MAG: UDP-glucose 4-epimerase GalE [Oscillospiraceae bacterium]|nr:UDP-glucose 4-epimerase GalE [Oscillospiraceae bacterium]